jgi:hypothetical protein
MNLSCSTMFRPYHASRLLGESILGGLFDFRPGCGELLVLSEGKGFWSASHCGKFCEKSTHDRLLSPSRLKSSIIRNISFLPAVASTVLPPRLILTFESVLTMSNLLSSKCRIFRQTNTPQSEELSCCGLSCSGMKRRGLLMSLESFCVTWCASY